MFTFLTHTCTHTYTLACMLYHNTHLFEGHVLDVPLLEGDSTGTEQMVSVHGKARDSIIVWRVECAVRGVGWRPFISFLRAYDGTGVVQLEREGGREAEVMHVKRLCSTVK